MNGFVLGVILLAVGTGVLGTLGVLAYMGMRNNILFLQQSAKLLAGRQSTTEHALQGCKATADKINEVSKNLQKLSSRVGQVRHEVGELGNMVCENPALDLAGQARTELKALAKELGYEVKTVDE